MAIAALGATGLAVCTMNHTAGVFLFNADGQHMSIIDYHEPREFALPKIRRAMGLQQGGSS